MQKDSKPAVFLLDKTVSLLYYLTNSKLAVGCEVIYVFSFEFVALSGIIGIMIIQVIILFSLPKEPNKST